MYITLRAVRKNLRLSVKQVSERTNISASTIRKWEADCSGARFNKFIILTNFYRISIDHIYIGKESNYVKMIAKNGYPHASHNKELKVVI